MITHFLYGKNCIIQKKSNKFTTKPYLFLENSTLNVKQCRIIIMQSRKLH